MRSPFAFINHTAQTKQLEPLRKCLGKFNLGVEDIAFTWQDLAMAYSYVGFHGHALGAMERARSEARRAGAPEDVRLNRRTSGRLDGSIIAAIIACQASRNRANATQNDPVEAA